MRDSEKGDKRGEEREEWEIREKVIGKRVCREKGCLGGKYGNG